MLTTAPTLTYSERGAVSADSTHETQDGIKQIRFDSRGRATRYFIYTAYFIAYFIYTAELHLLLLFDQTRLLPYCTCRGVTSGSGDERGTGGAVGGPLGRLGAGLGCAGDIARRGRDSLGGGIFAGSPFFLMLATG